MWSKKEVAHILFILVGCAKLVDDSHKRGDGYRGGEFGELLVMLKGGDG